MDQEKVGKFIAKLRKEKGMTQEELAKKLNVTDRAISHWENGRRLPDIFLFKSICEIFNISVNELISGEKSKNINDNYDKNIMKTIEYSNLAINRKQKAINIILSILALIIIIFSFTFMNSKEFLPIFIVMIGIIILTYSTVKIFVKKHKLILSIFTFLCIFVICFIIDYVCAVQMRRVPIFKISSKQHYTYYIEYNSLLYKTYLVNYDEEDTEYLIFDNNKYTEETLPISIFNRNKNDIERAIWQSKHPIPIVDTKGETIGKDYNYTSFLPLSNCNYSISFDNPEKLSFTCDNLLFKNDSQKYRKAFLYSSLVLFLTREDISIITYDILGEHYVAYREYFENNYPNYKDITEDNFNELVERKMYNDYFIKKIFDKLFVGEYIGEIFVRTYKILSINSGIIPNSYYLTINQCNGETADIYIKELNQIPEENKYYEFTIQPKVSTNYIEDTIESIFSNSRILGILEIDKICENQTQGKINRYNK